MLSVKDICSAQRTQMEKNNNNACPCNPDIPLFFLLKFSVIEIGFCIDRIIFLTILLDIKINSNKV